jgi:hypothetical protein
VFIEVPLRHQSPFVDAIPGQQPDGERVSAQPSGRARADRATVDHDDAVPGVVALDVRDEGALVSSDDGDPARGQQPVRLRGQRRRHGPRSPPSTGASSSRAGYGVGVEEGRLVLMSRSTEPRSNAGGHGDRGKQLLDPIKASLTTASGAECISCTTPCAPSGNVLDHRDELVDGVSLRASELDQLPHFLHDRAALGCSGNRNPAAAAKFEQSFVLEQS